jgi:excisionase family DNA binding protein
MSADETLGVEQAALLLHAENETVMQFARRGELPGTRIGKSWVFIREDVLAFLRARIEQDTLERRDHYAKAPLAIALERPKRSRRTIPPILPTLPKARD